MIHRFRVRILPQLHILMYNLKPILRHAILTTLRAERVDKPCDVYLALVNDEVIRELNLRHRQKDRVTDVLSFPYQNQTPGRPVKAHPGDLNPKTGRLMLGEIMICLPQAQRQAREYGHSLEREIAFLTVHAVLHLLGYDHEEGDASPTRQGDIMRNHERKVMELLQISR